MIPPLIKGLKPDIPKLESQHEGSYSKEGVKGKGYLLFSWRICVRNTLIVSVLALIFLFYLSFAGNCFSGIKLCPDMVVW